ncbi:MAG: tetratricopeptide repeat protein [Myxococcota bacterium]
MNKPLPQRRPSPRVAAIRSGSPKQSSPAVPVASQRPSSPRVPVARMVPMPASIAPAPAPSPKAVDEGLRSYVAVSSASEVVENVQPLKTAFFDTINKVNALTVIDKTPKVRAPSPKLSQRRSYERDDLFAIAEVAYHYLMNGNSRLAVVLMEGLTAVAPDEAYFRLALGLAQDHQGDKQAAIEAYEMASKLDPQDPRPHVNKAELLIESRRHAEAKPLLSRARDMARRLGDKALERKAAAILAHVEKQVSVGGAR